MEHLPSRAVALASPGRVISQVWRWAEGAGVTPSPRVAVSSNTACSSKALGKWGLEK